MHLHSRALKYLDEVTRTGSIRKAAMSLHVTPSAIDRRILLLEEQLGTAIYERHASGLRLTAAGEILAQHIRRTLQDLERTRSEIEDLRGLRRGRPLCGNIGAACLARPGTPRGGVPGPARVVPWLSGRW